MMKPPFSLLPPVVPQCAGRAPLILTEEHFHPLGAAGKPKQGTPIPWNPAGFLRNPEDGWKYEMFALQMD